MSIQPNRVVARIVEEVVRAPRVALPREVRTAAAFVDPAAGERLEVVRIGARDAHGALPFPSLLHFWMHALGAFLRATGQGDQLAGAASQALCERLSPGAIADERAALAARLRAPGDAALVLGADAAREAYRMIDGSCRRSFVVATDAEWVAATWAHGLPRELQVAAR